MKVIPILESADDSVVERKSSIDQFKGTLHIIKGGVYVPISFDVLDYIDCNKPHAHRAILGDHEYMYAIGKCQSSVATLVLSDTGEQDTVQAVKADNDAIGVKNVECRKIGLDYVRAKDNVKAVESDQITMAGSDDDHRVIRKSSIDQFKNTLHIIKGGVYVPISFDVLDYIHCGKPHAHLAILGDHDYLYAIGECQRSVATLVLSDTGDQDTVQAVKADNDAIGVKNVTHAKIGLDYVVAEDDMTSVETDKSMAMLSSNDDHKVHRKSSIDQYNNTLHIVKGGVSIPISFDTLDYIYCNKTVSHRTILSDGGDIGYHFEVGKRTFYSDLYVISDFRGTETAQLPAFFGEGFYDRYFSKNVLTVDDRSSLGTRTIGKRQVGLDYILADETITPVE